MSKKQRLVRFLLLVLVSTVSMYIIGVHLGQWVRVLVER